MTEKVLVTGGAGFIGSSLVLKLLENGYEVKIIDKLLKQIHGENLDSYCLKLVKGKVEIIKEDIANYEAVKKIVSKQDIIVHLASETGTGQSMYEITRYVDSNIKGTSVLLEVLAKEKHSVKKLILASSRAVYGEGKYLCKTHGAQYPQTRDKEKMIKKEFEASCPICKYKMQPLPTNEDSPKIPTSIYGITKLVQEQLIQNTMELLDISSTILRFQNVYGPGQSLVNPYTGIISIFTNLMLNEQEINIFEDGCESRDFIYIDDVVDAILLSLDMKNKKTNCFNVGSGKRVKVLDIAENLKVLLNSKSKISISGNFRIGDIRHNFADMTKFKAATKFHTKTNLREGLKEFIKWSQSQKNYDSKFSLSMEEMKKTGIIK